MQLEHVQDAAPQYAMSWACFVSQHKNTFLQENTFLSTKKKNQMLRLLFIPSHDLIHFILSEFSFEVFDNK